MGKKYGRDLQDGLTMETEMFRRFAAKLRTTPVTLNAG